MGTNIFGNGEFQAYFGTMFTAPSPNGLLLTQHHSSRTSLWTAVKDPQLDALIDKQAVMSKAMAARRQALTELQRYLLDSGHQLGVQIFAAAVGWASYARDMFISMPYPSTDQYNWMWIDK